MKDSLSKLSLALSLVFFACNRDGYMSLNQTYQRSSKKTTIQTSAVSDYQTYTISSVAGGKFIEVDGNITFNEKFQDSRLLVQYGPTQSDNLWQKWQVIYRSTVSNIKYYHIMNLHSGKLLSVPVGFTTTGLQLEQYLNYGSDAQLWRIQEIGKTGTCNIINKETGLAITNKSGSTTDGTPIVQEEPGPADSQKWKMNPVAADTYRDDAVVRFFNRNNTSQGSVAFDQGNTVPLTWSTNNGKVLWITQDAWDGTNIQSSGLFNCGGFHNYSNSVILQPSTTIWDSNAPNMTIPNSTSGKLRQVFNVQSTGGWSWAGPGVEIGAHVYVHVEEGTNGNDNPTSQSLYDLTQNTGTQWSSVRTSPAGMSGQVTIRYSRGMVKASDNYVYVFGSQSIRFGYGVNVYVARFPISNPQSWTFWNGSGWASTPSTAASAKIAEALGTVHVSYVNGKYVLMTMDNGFNCDDPRNVYLATSTSPTGGFTPRKQVYKIQEFLKGQFARYYTPIIHPEFNNGRNELLLTYSLNFSACGVDPCTNGYKDPYYYRVKAIRVPYSLIP